MSSRAKRNYSAIYVLKNFFIQLKAQNDLIFTVVDLIDVYINYSLIYHLHWYVFVTQSITMQNKLHNWITSIHQHFFDLQQMMIAKLQIQNYLTFDCNIEYI